MCCHYCPECKTYWLHVIQGPGFAPMDRRPYCINWNREVICDWCWLVKSFL